jgi:hypothetical protein
MSQLEQLTAKFAAIDADGRRYVLAVLEGEHERVQKSGRPALRLIQCGPAMPSAQDRTQREAI